MILPRWSDCTGSSLCLSDVVSADNMSASRMSVAFVASVVEPLIGNSALAGPHATEIAPRADHH